MDEIKQLAAQKVDLNEERERQRGVIVQLESAEQNLNYQTKVAKSKI